MNPFRLALLYMGFLVRSTSYRKLHSPYLFQVLKDSREQLPIPENVAELRRRLRKDNSLIQSGDPGAGSHFSQDTGITVRSIARHSPMPARRAVFLAKLAKAAGITTILELGTSLGISSLIIEATNPDISIITVEGNEGIARLAANHFQSNSHGRIRLVSEKFDQVIPGILEEYPQVGMTVLDGDHTKESTLSYYGTIMERSEQHILVIDDIRWSDDMLEAWKTICKDDLSKICLDYFWFGIVIRRRGMIPQYFRMRY